VKTTEFIQFTTNIYEFFLQMSSGYLFPSQVETIGIHGFAVNLINNFSLTLSDRTLWGSR